MRHIRGTAVSMLLLLVFAGLAPISAEGQTNRRPRRSTDSYNRSYQVGYDEGYRKGYEKGNDDAQDGRRRNVTDFKEYRRGDDGYNSGVGDRDDYKLGYRSGFEQAYTDALTGQQYGARPGQSRVVLPRGQGRNGGVLRRRGRGNRNNDPYATSPYPGSAPQGTIYGQGNRGGFPGGARRVGFDTSMVIELETPINTEYSREGDRFTAIVVEPRSYYGARVEGFIGKLEKPGRVSGKGEVVLVFREMIWPDGFSEPLEAQVEEVIGYERGYPRAGRRAPWEIGRSDDRNDDIDAEAGDEGEIKGEGSKGRDAAVVGGGAAIGAVIGGVLGGGSGAAVGAVIGAATGGGVVASTRGEHIDLEPGARLRIRTGRSPQF